jgi:hypothetical protein
MRADEQSKDRQGAKQNMMCQQDSVTKGQGVGMCEQDDASQLFAVGGGGAIIAPLPQ